MAEDQIFEINHSSGWARAGRLKLAHGTLSTPAFMPVGTYGAVKGLAPPELKAVGTQILLGNTYHLYLRPGLKLLRQVGGLHKLMNWSGPILTDSGGFQVFSLAQLGKVTDEGVHFRSHLNGDAIFLTPELSAEIQQAIGSDIAMVLDECLGLPNSKSLLDDAVLRSVKWARRFFDVPRIEGQKIFGILQGGTYNDLRMKSLELTMELPLDGLAIGGLSVGEPHSVMVETLENLAPHLPTSLPHYLMGVGTPLDLLEAIRQGIDLFDCVMPTRNGRNGGFFTDEGLLNIRNQCFQYDEGPILEGCHCPCCQSYSRAYLRHLFNIKEMLGCRLATLHNLHYYHVFVRSCRGAIEAGSFEDFYLNRIGQLKEAYPERSVVAVGEAND